MTEQPTTNNGKKPIWSLRDFLLDAFTVQELKGFLIQHVETVDQAVSAGLPRQEYATEVASALHRHGELRPALFDALMETRAKRHAEIEAIAERCGCGKYAAAAAAPQPSPTPPPPPRPPLDSVSDVFTLPSRDPPSPDELRRRARAQIRERLARHPRLGLILLRAFALPHSDDPEQRHVQVADALVGKCIVSDLVYALIKARSEAAPVAELRRLLTIALSLCPDYKEMATAAQSAMKCDGVVVLKLGVITETQAEPVIAAAEGRRAAFRSHDGLWIGNSCLQEVSAVAPGVEAADEAMLHSAVLSLASLFPSLKPPVGGTLAYAQQLNDMATGRLQLPDDNRPPFYAIVSAKHAAHTGQLKEYLPSLRLVVLNAAPGLPRELLFNDLIASLLKDD